MRHYDAALDRIVSAQPTDWIEPHSDLSSEPVFSGWDNETAHSDEPDTVVNSLDTAITVASDNSSSDSSQLGSYKSASEVGLEICDANEQLGQALNASSKTPFKFELTSSEYNVAKVDAFDAVLIKSAARNCKIQNGTSTLKEEEPDTFVESNVIEPISHALDVIPQHDKRTSIALTDLDNNNDHGLQISDRRCYHVRLGETLQSVSLRDPLMNDVRLWKLLASINGLSIEVDGTGRPTAKLTRGQYLVLPNEAEVVQFKNDNKVDLVGIDRSDKNVREQGKPATDSNKENTEMSKSSIEYEKLDDHCRVVLIQSSVNSIILQLETDQRWRTVARYDCSNSGISRSLIHSSGAAQHIRVDLPLGIAIDMAKEDFRRNWTFYCDSHFLQQKFGFVPAHPVNSALPV